jgi:hypothetical protein
MASGFLRVQHPSINYLISDPIRRMQMNAIVAKTLSLACTAAVMLSSIASGPAMAGGRPLHASLTGAAEVPPPGDPDGSGEAFITLNHGLGEVCFEIYVSNIAPATVAHIHEAPEGEAGPKRLDLTPPSNGFSQGCMTQVDQGLIKRMLQNPSGFYVNIHNADFVSPHGAIRGQLSK